MKNTNTITKLMAVSFIAIAAVSTAHAKMVSETMLSGTDAGYYGTGTGQKTVKSEIATKQDKLGSTNVTQTGSGVVRSVSAADGAVSITASALEAADLPAATSSAKGGVQLAADSQNSTQVNTTAENVSNKVTATSGLTSTQKTSTSLYPSMATVNKLINDTAATASAGVSDIRNEIGFANNEYTAFNQGISATTVIGAINELDNEKQNIQAGAGKVGGADSVDKDKTMVIGADGKLTKSTNKLGSAAWVDTTAFDAAGAATAAKNSITATGNTGVTASAENGAITVSGVKATNSALGVVKGGGNVSVDSNGQLSVAEASTSAKGIMKVGDDLKVSSGTVSVDKSTTVASGDGKPVSSGAVYTALHNFAGAFDAEHSTDGTYVLTATISNGVATYHWEDIGR